MTAPVTLAAAVAASRVFALREACVTTLATLFPDVHVTAHPGKLDIADVVAGDVFRAPAFAVAASRIDASNGPSSGLRDAPVGMTCYLAIEDVAAGDPPRLIKRDEAALALADALVGLLEDPAAPETRWGLVDVSFPEQVEARPVFTAHSFARGVVYWAVTWRQTIRSGAPLWDMDTIVAAGDIPPVVWPDGSIYPAPPEPAP